jgi:hypothetical protein
MSRFDTMKDRVAANWSGRLKAGTIRRVTSTTVNNLGDPVTTAPVEYSFEGFKANHSQAYLANNEVSNTDARIMALLGSIKGVADPAQTTKIQMQDLINLEGVWYKVGALMGEDVSGALQTVAVSVVPAPEGA